MADHCMHLEPLQNSFIEGRKDAFEQIRRDILTCSVLKKFCVNNVNRLRFCAFSKIQFPISQRDRAKNFEPIRYNFVTYFVKILVIQLDLSLIYHS